MNWSLSFRAAITLSNSLPHHLLSLPTKKILRLIRTEALTSFNGNPSRENANPEAPHISVLGRASTLGFIQVFKGLTQVLTRTTSKQVPVFPIPS
jgi:hypothetical protein